MNRKIRWFIWGVMKATKPMWRSLGELVLVLVVGFVPVLVATLLGASEKTVFIVLACWPVAPVGLFMLVVFYCAGIKAITKGKEECLRRSNE